MASGWGPDGAAQDQIDSTVDNAVQRARDALGAESERVCQECGEEIPQACATACLVRLKKQTASSFYNRRGSKDIQLRYYYRHISVYFPP